FVRAIIYRRIIWPIRKRRVHKRYRDEGTVSHAYFMVTTYLVETEVSVMVYKQLFNAAANAVGGATVVASVVYGADERLIRQIYDSHSRDLSNVRLIIDRIPSKGKRDAIAKALNIIRTFNPTHRDICVFVDGDTVVPDNIVSESAPVLTEPGVGALTTDEGVLIEKKNLFRDWFVLRFNQRQVMFCSQGLSKHVLTLTGRMSVFRADLATTPSFIEGIDHDTIQHWRLGEIVFLTGDDKSTWYWLLKNGYEMWYLPDARSWSVETQPRPSFVASAQVLMVRWFGNMMRTNGRALGISPALIGPFTWYAILDQRLSAWTTLVGPLSVVMAALLHDVYVIPLYIAWVLSTRYIFCVIINLFRGTWFPITHPPILYFGQVFGAAVKTFVLFRLNKQRWTRQAAAEVAQSPVDRQKAQESTLHHTLAVVWLCLGVFFLSQV
ncbi:MAG: glycosyltransferase, partial [Halocynthiibacter sp.]